jgi:hypothetical protein
MPRGRGRVSKPKTKARKGKKSGKMSTNTKVDLVAVYRTDQLFLTFPTNIPPKGAWNYTTYSPFNNATWNITQSAEFQAQKMLYDEFCITSVKVEYLPNINVVSRGDVIASADNSYSIHTMIDRDGQIPITSAVNIPQKLESYDSYKRFDFRRKFTRTLKCNPFWIDTTTTAIDPRGTDGFTQPYTNAGLFQILVFYCENLPLTSPNVTVGHVRVHFNVKFRGKKPVSYTVLADGVSVVMTPVEAFTGDVLEASNPPLPVNEVLYENVVECDDTTHEIFVRSNWNGSRVPPA